MPRLKIKDRKFDARPDTLDFRDKIFVATLNEVPPVRTLEEYCRVYDGKAPILDQGVEGACTGFGLAAVANYLLHSRRVCPDTACVSPRMFYEMARRYDEWPGADYEGSSARGAMKGWHKHGVCADERWPYKGKKGNLTPERSGDATLRPLGAYFRVNHKDYVAMHSALADVGILYATATVHSGWGKVGKDGRIPFEEEFEGGHAFAIVAYDNEGFWIQNSWGPDWGKDGFAHISYDDWLTNGTDVWVARLGVPVVLRSPKAVATAQGDQAAHASAMSFEELRPHIVTIGNNGVLARSGPFANTDQEVKSIFTERFAEVTKNWKGPKKILLYAHGGLTGADAAVQRVADYRGPLLQDEIYPLAFIWKTDYWTTLTNMLRDAISRRKPEGIVDSAKDFMLDRLDDALEPLARGLTGKAQWDEMKENAQRATTARDGGARFVAQCLADLAKRDGIELHVVGHSAGSILHASLVQLLATKGKIAKGPMAGATGLGLTIGSCTMWAPACTMELFQDTYLPLMNSGGIKRFSLFVLNDTVEQEDDCAKIYHKSLLYLVSNAFEKTPRIPLLRPDGVPLLGMAKWAKGNAVFKKAGANLVIAPNDQQSGVGASRCRHHGDFDDDEATLNSTLALILGKGAQAAKDHEDFNFVSSSVSRQAKRQAAVAGD